MDKEAPEEAVTEAPTDPKEQMRLALERKHSKEKAGKSHADGQAKADHASGPSGGTKMFRRKSGG
jgi:hypothetical protein